MDAATAFAMAGDMVNNAKSHIEVAEEAINKGELILQEMDRISDTIVSLKGRAGKGLQGARLLFASANSGLETAQEFMEKANGNVRAGISYSQSAFTTGNSAINAANAVVSAVASLEALLESIALISSTGTAGPAKEDTAGPAKEDTAGPAGPAGPAKEDTAGPATKKPGSPMCS